jgi:hypothetical protein
MARLNNKLVIKQMPWHANMTELNHLGAAFLTKPTVFEPKMTQVFTAQRYSDNPLTKMLSWQARKNHQYYCMGMEHERCIYKTSS